MRSIKPCLQNCHQPFYTCKNKAYKYHLDISKPTIYDRHRCLLQSNMQAVLKPIYKAEEIFVSTGYFRIQWSDLNIVFFYLNSKCSLKVINNIFNCYIIYLKLNVRLRISFFLVNWFWLNLVYLSIRKRRIFFRHLI